MSDRSTSTLAGILEEKLLDTSESKPVYLYTASNGSYVRLSASAFFLLQAVRSGMTFQQIATVISERSDGQREIREEEIRKIHDALVKQISNIEKQPSELRLPSGFWFRLRLLPEKVVSPWASMLSALYKPHLAAFILASVVGTFIGLHHLLIISSVSQSSLVSAYLLFLISIMFHEFGHASACARFGVRPAEIGFAFYLVYPAFYSDVTGVWQLSRWERVIVDFGGTYFQFIIGACFLILYRFSGYQSFQIACWMIWYTSIFCLNPIFKFDGYWVLADLLGVTNLGRQPWRILKSVMRGMFGLQREKLQWPISITAILVGYSFVSIVVWGFFLWELIPTFYNTFRAMINSGRILCVTLAAWRMPRASDLESLFVSGFLMVIFAAMIWRLGQQLISAAGKRFSRKSGVTMQGVLRSQSLTNS